jgi:hypothetical protein
VVNICADRELNLTAYQNYFGSLRGQQGVINVISGAGSDFRMFARPD